MKKTIYFAAFLLLLNSCKKDPETGYIIKGQVKNGNTVVGNAKVQLNDNTAGVVTTDNNGYFELRNVPSGTQTLTVTKQHNNGGYITRSQSLTIKGNTDLSSYIIPSPLQLTLVETVPDISMDKIRLAWTQTDAVDFYEYRLYRHSTSGLDENTGTLIHVSTSVIDTLFTDSIPHNSNYFYRLYIRNLNNQLGGSNIINVADGSYNNNLDLNLSERRVGYMSKSESYLFNFNATKGEFYKIDWWDTHDYLNGFDTAKACVYISGYQEDKSTNYFYKAILDQQKGCPQTIYANNTEKTYLKIEGCDSQSKGTFELEVTKLDKNSATNIAFDNAFTTSVNPGEIKLYYANVQMNNTYTISMSADSLIGAYGDNVWVTVSAFKENSIDTYFVNEIPTAMFTQWGPSAPLNKIISPTQTEKMYLLVTGAYWKDPRTVTITISQ